MAIKPLRDHLIVKRLEEEEMTKGGIIIPDSAKEKPAEAEVIAVGPGRKDDNGKVIEMEVKVGDKVIFSEYAGTSVKIDGEDLLVISETEVIAVVD